MNGSRSATNPVAALPKLCGADIELGNFIMGAVQPGGSSYEASRALLAKMHGFPLRHPNGNSYPYGTHSYSAYSPYGRSPRPYVGFDSTGDTSSYNPQEVERRFLSNNGGAAYIDLNHVELCIPEVLSAFDHVAAWHGMLRVARAALHAANDGRPAEDRVKVLVNNSDGRGNSYGSHLNFLISRRAFDNLFCRKAHYLQLLASFQVSSMILTGQGKVGSENGRPDAAYQISQRADFFVTLQGSQTTQDRPLVNSRDEALCGKLRYDDPAPARLHVIFFDNALAHGSALFRVGPMQLILTLLELGLVNTRLALDDPIDSVWRYSHDPMLRVRAELITGKRLSAVELQSAYLEEVKRHAARGVFEGIVPRADEIIALWEDTVTKLARKDWMAAAPRLDWIMKLMTIDRAMDQRPELSWTSPEVKVIDMLYSDLDVDGLYWSYEADGFAEQLVPAERIAYFTENPPEDTRAWLRSALLRRANPATVVSVDWDEITFKLRGKHNWSYFRTVDLADPLRGTKADVESLFQQCADFDDLLDALESRPAGEPPITETLVTNRKKENTNAIPATIG